MFFLRWVVLIAYKLVLVASQSDCQSQVSSCGSCISYQDKNCVWCSDEAMDIPRCQSKEYDVATAGWCKTKFESPQSTFTIRSNLDINVNGEGKKVHFYPQDVLVKIRRATPVAFNITYKLGRAYPLDLYFLTDYSYSMSAMKDYNGMSALEVIRKKVQSVQKEVANLTDNVYMGFGKFMEKPVLPYGPSDALSFEHVVTLTNNTPKIVSAVKKGVYVGGNFDGQEACLDGLLQVMVCKEDVGWRDLARRIIVLCTDGLYHGVGDGKMLGILTPSDDLCRLKDRTYRDASKKYDYPSVGLINKIARDKNIQILFVAPENLRRDYSLLSQFIQGSEYVPLTADFLSKISYYYEQSLIHPQLDILKAPRHIQVTIEPSCHRQISETVKEECKVGLDQDKTVQVKLELISYPESEEEETVEIGIVGLDAKLTIGVIPLYKCGCEININNASMSICSGNGYLQCGVCKCNTGWSGISCDCSGEGTQAKYLKNCRFQNEIDTCSGRGECRCGKCVCNAEYSGDFCQFDDKACATSQDGKLCAGHGNCTLGKCNCKPGWTGADCDCPLSNEDCIPPFPKTECFGNGECQCGRCHCKAPPENSDVRYFGQFCQSSLSRCKELDGIVKCRHMSNDTCSGTEDSQLNSNLDLYMVNKTEFDKIDQTSYLLCTIEMETGGVIKYRYQNILDKHTKKMRIIIQTELEYSGLPVHILATIGGIIGMVLLVGLVTLLAWKILIDRRDAWEYAQYEEELKNQEKMENNILYVEPASRFANPMYNSEY